MKFRACNGIILQSLIGIVESVYVGENVLLHLSLIHISVSYTKYCFNYISSFSSNKSCYS